MQRLRQLVQQVAAVDPKTTSGREGRVGLAGPSGPLGACPARAELCGAGKSDDDVVICSALRVPICKAKRGSYKDSAPEDLLVPLFKATLQRAKISPKEIHDVQIGNALAPGAAALAARTAQIMAGFPLEVPCSTVNRQCSSGLQAVANIAANIKAGIIDVGIAGGVESMTMYSMTDLDPRKFSDELLEFDSAAACLLPMGITSENVAEKWGISRERQDAMAVASHSKAVRAQQAGFFKDELVPIRVRVKDARGTVKDVLVDTDEGPRASTSMASLGALKPAFRAGGSTTAGNSSQVSDGAAMVLLARRSAAKKLGLPILARFRSFASVGVDPALMGIGPAFAIPVALEKAGLTVEDIDIFEINEAFASQATMSVEHLKIPMEKVNPKGGAIALGHPLGCTGSRQIATILPELRRTGKKLGIISMCVGTGMGAAGVVELE